MSSSSHVLPLAKDCRNCLNARPLGQVFKQFLRDPASVKAMKQKIGTVRLAKYLVLIKAAMRPI